ncbi:hypothetical protein PILCRDRAFT_92808 [Piloderma croceum F 1598]|uniref:Uncharacterized protein n=1 Tax=Piloderma croceum (strain F 1598) TaxID=765440 RepID=A0A0C3EN10_PILCF|nr:hypothetical protein PILCRDRAFT_92808 [Piloderma croceum F 1598]
MSQIEAGRDEQMVKGASLIDPLFARTRMRHRAFVVISSVVNADSDMSDEVSSMVDDTETSSIASSSSKAGRSWQGGVVSSGADLRKKLLKSEQAKSTGRKTRAQEVASPSGSRQATPAVLDVVMVDGVEEGLSATSDTPHQTGCDPSRKYFSVPLLAIFFSVWSSAYCVLTGSRPPLFKTMSSTQEVYKIFTIDQYQGTSHTGGSQIPEFLELLKKERTHGTLTIQDQINSRQNAARLFTSDISV